jgi:K+-sensing histidine kinase KdpD
LRSPLSSLIGFHQLILNGLCENPEEEKEFLTSANQFAKKLLNLIDEIVAISRTQSGTNQPQWQKVQLKKVFTEINFQTRLQAANRNVKLDIITTEGDIYVKADPHWLRQLLVMLVDTVICREAIGNIELSTQAVKELDLVQINLNLSYELNLKSEPLDLLNIPLESNQEKLEFFSRQLEASKGMRLLLCQTLLEFMSGRLEIVEPPTTKETLTQVRCWLPLAETLEKD